MSSLFATPCIVAQQAPLSTEFPRQEYWSGLPFPSLRDLADPGIKLTSAASSAWAGDIFTTEPLGKPFSSLQLSSVTQSCPTLSDPMDCSLPGLSVHGIFQARVVEWGAIAFSNLKVDHVRIELNFRTSSWYHRIAQMCGDVGIGAKTFTHQALFCICSKQLRHLLQLKIVQYGLSCCYLNC